METDIKSKILPALVVAVDLQNVVIICPFCGKFHWHSSGGYNNKTKYGTRAKHCTDDVVRREHRFSEYELITSENTIRRETILPKDLTVWRSRQRSARRDIKEQWRLQEETARDEKIWRAIRDIHTSHEELARWLIAYMARVAPIYVTRWMNKHGIYYSDGQYQVESESKAGPELCEIFTVYKD